MDHLNEGTAAKHSKEKKAAFIFCHLPLAEPGVDYSIGSQYMYKVFWMWNAYIRKEIILK